MADKRYAGFLDGYRAGNVAHLEEKFEIDKAALIDSLDSFSIKFADDSNLQSAIDAAKSALQSRNLDILSLIVSFGERMLVVAEVYQIGSDGPLNPHLKRTVYRYLDIAEQLDDADVTALALRLGNKLAVN